MVACEQWNAGNDAGGGNQFIRRVGVEVKLCAGTGDVQVDGDNGQLLQAGLKSRTAQVKRDPPKLNQFG
jgi:hypothetical protein